MISIGFTRRTAIGVALSILAGCARQGGNGTAARPEHPDAQLAAEKVAPTTGPAAAKDKDGWRELFDGKTLSNWKASDFAGAGEPRVENGTIIVPNGDLVSGVTFTGANLPKMNYEVSLEAQRVNGSDFFCALTVPHNDSFVTLVIGGWGGGLVGISSLDGDDAAHNDSSSTESFATGKWYKIRFEVTPNHLDAWIDDKQVVNVSTKDRKVSIRPDIEASTPFGLATYQTSAAYRTIRVREIAAEK
jgi:hypothetical protein